MDLLICIKNPAVMDIDIPQPAPYCESIKLILAFVMCETRSQSCDSDLYFSLNGVVFFSHIGQYWGIFVSYHVWTTAQAPISKPRLIHDIGSTPDNFFYGFHVIIYLFVHDFIGPQSLSFLHIFFINHVLKLLSIQPFVDMYGWIECFSLLWVVILHTTFICA